MLLRVYDTFMRILLVRMSSMCMSLYLSVALCVSRFVCMSLLEYVLPFPMYVASYVGRFVSRSALV